MTEIPVAATLVLVRDGHAGAIEVLLLQRPDRGAFAGGWVFPGGRVEPVDEAPDEETTARNAAVRETAEETGLVVHPDALVPLSHWSPPEQLATKFHTWFFAAEASEGDVVLQEAEAVASMWIRPADALKLHGKGELRLFPPTWVTLDTLLTFPTVDAALSSLASRPLRRYATKQDHRRGLALWEGDEAYDGGPDTEDGPRHRLHVGALPWRFEHR
ncbi:NUDIX domain-containing protein [Agrococcus sp. HG114]|uniref:NUDIX hydrolase n=1 Tax=Agrococcus sp. HG114 TaxID=2969757 RepID=UPI00215B1A0C|nr:NUDIX domain-containing protein [Agrococcus sp. HG114]MCR8670833.1 NUDIX domain-containing protein [Agrococcus sp. HG114]